MNEKSLSTFTMLPPFWINPIYKKSQKYLDRIKEEFNLDIQTYSYKKSAFDHDVFIINNEIVFRFPREERGRNHLKHEIAFLNFLKDKTKVDIPNYKYVAKKKDFAGYKIIQGQILSPSVFSVLSKKNKEKVIDSLIGFVNTFHSIKQSNFVKFKPRKRSDFIEIEKKTEKELKNVIFPKLSKEEVEAIKEFYQKSKRYLQNLPRICPIRGELYAYNVIWNKENSKIGIIDFTDYLLGDPAKDFEVFYNYGKDSVQIAYEKYEGSKDKDFLTRAEIYYKVHSIYTLLSSLCGASISFQYARNSFRQRFNL
ncbi:MAG: aminoglycoside phosphotransferase family protein [Nanoarchaeota archaeon]|nr:aminoglycoside phosphotransferase family protein [Nanoarchaeota archaeon]